MGPISRIGVLRDVLLMDVKLFVVIAIVAAIVVTAILVIAIQARKNKNKASGNISFGLLIGLFFCSILLLVVGPVLALPHFIERIEDIVALSKDHMGAVLFFTGILSFAISLLIMSFFTFFSISADKEQRVKSLFRLDRKEIRRSIAISFTILYIMIIAFYFQEAASVAKSLAEISDNLAMGSAMNTTMIAAMNSTLTAKGITPLSNGLSAFTTVYLVIIGFYFGSRVYEKIKEIKDADEVLKIRYIMDEISDDDFDIKMEKLRRKITPDSQLVITENNSDEKKITIKHQGGENINLKDIRIILIIQRKNKQQTKSDLLEGNSKKEGKEPTLTVFGVTDKIIIDLDKITKNKSDCITLLIGKKTIGVEYNSYDDIGKTFEWENDAKFEVTVIYKPTKEIITEKKLVGKNS